ncbi:MAG TPA: hypothetical protein V6C50_12290 [Crinalium sp.]
MQSDALKLNRSNKQLQAFANNPVTSKTWNQTTAFNSDKTLVLSTSDRKQH